MKHIKPFFGAKAIAAAVMLSSFGWPAVSTMAGPNDAEGRWKAERRDLVLDIGRCGDKICGTLVNAENKCGAPVLTAVISSGADLVGDLALPDATNPKFPDGQ